MKRLFTLFALAAFLWPALAHAQGVTTGTILGTVVDAQKQPIQGATVVAIHLPSGTTYEAATRADGRFAIPGMRVGGPYSVTVAHGGAGAAFEPQVQENVMVNLGVATDLAFVVNPISVAEEVTVTAKSDPIFSSERTGAATALSRDTLASLPTISGRLESVVRLTPQSGGNMSFAGQDNRLNNITVDGSVFNNSFGLRSVPGETSGVAPISLWAIEQIQVNVAPFDVRQGNFVGANVNTVTRSGTNQYRGSLYHQFRDNSLVGTTAKDLAVNPGTFDFRNTGGWGGGPIVKNRAFFFGNYENEAFTQPGTTFRANLGGEAAAGSVTRVLASDLNTLSSFLSNNFNYETGPYENYSFETPAKRYLAKVDYNLNERNKVSVRYNHLDSKTDQLASNSSSLGFGTRRTTTQALNFANSNYIILENIRSIVGEWNSVIGTTMSNNLLAGFTHQDESRESRGTFFPFVDINQGGSVYTSFGFEPFTPNNELRYDTFQLQNNFTMYTPKHSLTFGGSIERYESENIFFPGSQSVYVYNSLNDFYTDANGYLANPNRTTSPITLRRFQVRWNNIPGQDVPLQPLEVFYTGLYAQDDWRVRNNLKVNLGLRIDVPFFGETGYANADADARVFRDENGAAVQYSTAKLPDASILWSPRFGFNWDVNGNLTTQVRGGTGIFTGRPAYVWISNQIGNTGVLTGFEALENPTNRPFHPDPDHYKPANVTGAPASSYELALTNEDFKFPQLWRTNIAVDRRLGWGWTGTVEFLHSKDVNGIYYINANLPAAQGAFLGVDPRPRWVAASGNATRIHQNVQNAVVLKNQNEGSSWNLALSAERPLTNGLWLKGAYSYGESKNTVDPGSIAFGSWNNNQHSGDPNNPGIGYAIGSPGHRFFASASYTREYFGFGGTTVSVYWESRTIGNASYTYTGDLNGDGGTSNDLIYIPRDISEMNFQAYTDGGVTYTAAAQAAAWDQFIASDSYLSKHRGSYVQRGAVFLPLVHRADLSVAQDFYVNILGRRNTFQFRMDVDNFTNLLNDEWGVGQRLVFSSTSPPINSQPLSVPSAAQGGPIDAQGRAQYRLRPLTSGGALPTNSLEQTAGIADVYRIMFSLRYTF
jgi:hypothetical protein